MSEQLKMQTKDLAEENAKKLMELFPNAVTETIDINGNVVRAIDKDILQQEINAAVVEGREERYQFTWPDKKKAIAEANKPITKTLRPCREESVDFDNTENLYIEGDNLEVLKLLQETYLGKVKMIYIDPPYNTGHDMVYQDDFRKDNPKYKAESGDYDEEGNQLFENTTSNGRFHTDWLNMMYPRLKLAKNLLTDDGVIFISIDDNEVENLKKICDEVYGESNFVAQIAWQNLDTVKNDARLFSDNHEYIVVYAKMVSRLEVQGVKKGEKQRSYYKNYDNDPRGDYLLTPLHAKSGSDSGVYSYTFKNGQTWMPPMGTYPRFSKATLEQLELEGAIYLDPKGEKVPQRKTYLVDVGDRMPPVTFWNYENFGSTRQSNKELAELIGKGIFQNPKPTKIVYILIDLVKASNDSIILDFFSGSATTAHAVMQLNAEDGGHRKFIMVQLPEECDEKSEAFKAGYKNICEIGKERIRRAGKKIVEGLNSASQSGEGDRKAVEGLDIGFRVMKVDESNMKEGFYLTPNKLAQENIQLFEENVKDDRTAEDLLFQAMLEIGLLPSNKIEVLNVQGKQVFRVTSNEGTEGYCLACFDEGLNEEIITEIAKMNPCYFVTQDRSIASDSLLSNFEQIFKTYDVLYDENRTIRMIGMR